MDKMDDMDGMDNVDGVDLVDDVDDVDEIHGRYSMPQYIRKQRKEQELEARLRANHPNESE